MVKALWRLALSGVHYGFDLLLPPVCVSCATLVTGHNLLCPKCWAKVERITPPVCDRLGLPMPGAEGEGPHVSLQALAEPPAFDRGRAATLYTGEMRRLITRFKFEDRHEPYPLFLRLLQDAGRDLLAEADLIVPVPLHRFRLLQRRFNQSALLAKGLAKATSIEPGLTVLRRTRRTRPQVGLDYAARQHNVKAAFAVTPFGRGLVAGKRVLLIDDVRTTGATLNACASALKAAGAVRVNVLTLAAALPGLNDDILF